VYDKIPMEATMFLFNRFLIAFGMILQFMGTREAEAATAT